MVDYNNIRTNVLGFDQLLITNMLYIDELLGLLDDIKGYGLDEDDENMEEAVVEFIGEYSELKIQAYTYTINPIQTQSSIDSMVELSNIISNNQSRIEVLNRENTKEGELVGRLSRFLSVF